MSTESSNKRLEHRPMDFIGVLPSGTLVYVGMQRREEFDRIASPLTDHGEDDNGHVLSKCVEGDGVRVVFQYWLKSRTDAAFSADMAREREARS